MNLISSGFSKDIISCDATHNIHKGGKCWILLLLKPASCRRNTDASSSSIVVLSSIHPGPSVQPPIPAIHSTLTSWFSRHLPTSPTSSPCAASEIIGTTMADNKLQGSVKWFSNKKGFGFITPAEGSSITDDVFVHQSSIFCEGYRTLVSSEESAWCHRSLHTPVSGSSNRFSLSKQSALWYLSITHHFFLSFSHLFIYIVHICNIHIHI